MVPMIDMMMASGPAGAVIAVSPALIGVGIALVGGLAWMLRETAQELGRGTTPQVVVGTVPADHDRIAA